MEKKEEKSWNGKERKKQTNEQKSNQFRKGRKQSKK